jgi:hypothetical protein
MSNINLKSSLIYNKGKLILDNCSFEDIKGLGVNGLIINNAFNSSNMISNSSFINNDAGDTARGAVLLMDYSKELSINNSIFTGNHAYFGGVLYNNLYDNGRVNIINSVFKDNSASNGGCIYNKDSHLSIQMMYFRKIMLL